MILLKDEVIEEEKKKIKKALSVLNLVSNLFLLKAKAFKEEREWRLISYFTKSGDNDSKFRVMDNRITPYREFNLLSLDERVINEIIIGPKNLTPIYVVEQFLKKYGFTNVKVLRSTASYR